jgi:hypothetical protein
LGRSRVDLQVGHQLGPFKDLRLDKLRVFSEVLLFFNLVLLSLLIVILPHVLAVLLVSLDVSVIFLIVFHVFLLCFNSLFPLHPLLLEFFSSILVMFLLPFFSLMLLASLLLASLLLDIIRRRDFLSLPARLRVML